MNYLEGQPVNPAELTDPDGDALTITSDSSGTWITCTSDAEEVTVGPFLADALSAALSKVLLASGEMPWSAA